MLYRSFFTIAGAAVAAALVGVLALMTFAHFQGDASSRAFAAQVSPTPVPVVSTPTPVGAGPSVPPRGRAFWALRARLARLRGIVGHAVKADANSLTIQRAPQTVSLDAETKIIVVGKPNAQIQDFHAGDKILALGAGIESARLVLAAPADYTRDNLRVGRVTQAQANQFTLQTARGALKVSVENDSQIVNAQLQPLALDTLQNKIVLLIGVSSADGIRAQVVLARTAP